VGQEVYGEFARIQEAEKQAASAVTMLALVHRAQARLELSPPPSEEKEIELTPALAPKMDPTTIGDAQSGKSSSGSNAEEQLTKGASYAMPDSTSGANLPGSKPPAAHVESNPVSTQPAATEAALPSAEKFPTSSTVQPTTDEDRDFPI
jgi:hypothetical protein